MEAQLSNGLIIGHAYSVTDVRYVSPPPVFHSRSVVVVSTWGNLLVKTNDHHLHLIKSPAKNLFLLFDRGWLLATSYI